MFRIYSFTLGPLLLVLAVLVIWYLVKRRKSVKTLGSTPKTKMRLNQVKKGSLMWRLIGLDDLHNPESELRKALDRIAERESAGVS